MLVERFALAVCITASTDHALIPPVYPALLTTSFRFAPTLQPAVKSVRCALSAWLDGLRPSGHAAMKTAFQAAFRILGETAIASGCETAVIFLSDGLPSDDTEDPRDFVVAEMAGLSKVTLFSFSLSEADPRVNVDGRALVEDLACDTGGLFSHISYACPHAWPFCLCFRNPRRLP